MPVSKQKAEEIVELSRHWGVDEIAKRLGINVESVSRYLRIARKHGVADKKASLAQKLSAVLNEKELKELLKKSGLRKESLKAKAPPAVDGEITIGAMTDLHLGSKYTDPNDVVTALSEMNREGCDFITVSGDITAGLKLSRLGSVFELTHIGVDAQKSLAIDVLGYAKDTPLYMIDGNHDRWYMESAGVNIVKDIADALPDATFLGHDEGSIKTRFGEVRLWHGNDANTLSISRRVQDIVDMLSRQDDKVPMILLCGHTHKALYLPGYKHCHAFSCGSIERQSAWMRGKKIEAHNGFWIIRVRFSCGRIHSINPTWRAL